MDAFAFIYGFLNFINTTVVPLLVAVAFVVFLWNIVRFFIIGSDSPTAKADARQQALYGILAFVVIASLWGIVNLFVDGFGFAQDAPVCPDYIDGPCTSNSTGAGEGYPSGYQGGYRNGDAPGGAWGQGGGAGGDGWCLFGLIC